MQDVWRQQRHGELLWLIATLLAYLGGDRLFRAAGRSPLVKPVLVAVVTLAVLLRVSGTDYATYFAGARFAHFMLGPATVALALPLWPTGTGCAERCFR